MAFNYNHLYSFHVIATVGSVTAAAKKLLVSQPALSAQIRLLEERIEQRLFSRVGNGIELTQAGSLLFKHTTRLFAICDQMLKDLGGLRERKRGLIRIGIADGIERPFSVGLVGQLFENRSMKSRPRVQMVAGSHDALLKQVRAQEVDFLLSDRDAVELESLGTFSMPVVLAVKGELLQRAGGPRDTLASLLSTIEQSDLGIILPGQQFRLREDTERYLSGNSLRVRVVLETDQMASLVRGVIDGIGAALLPLPYVQSAVSPRNLVAFGLPHGLWRHTLSIHHARGCFAQPYVADMEAAFHKFTQRIQVEENSRE